MSPCGFRLSMKQPVFSRRICCGFWCIALVIAPALRADDLAMRTVILVNSLQPESVALGRDYAKQRGIPAANLVALAMPTEETIRWHAFVDRVWQPLQDELLLRGWISGLFAAGGERDGLGRRKVKLTGHRMAYLVVCRGTPLRIEPDPSLRLKAVVAGRTEENTTNQGAVDSELTMLAIGGYDLAGWLPNPYFNTARPPAVASLVVKVSRLDGPTWEDARGLVRSALAGEREGLGGRYYVDTGGPFEAGDTWLEETARQLGWLGLAGEVDRNKSTFGPEAKITDAAWYFGWYAGELNGPFAQPGFRFRPGAIALHIHSFSAETLHSPMKNWCGPLVARGAAATFGNVYEPYLALSERPDLLVAALVRGETLGDAAYAAMPALSWKAIVIGDPLYRPVPTRRD